MLRIRVGFIASTSTSGTIVLSPGATARISQGYALSPNFVVGGNYTTGYVGVAFGFSFENLYSAGHGQTRAGHLSLEYSNSQRVPSEDWFSFIATVEARAKGVVPVPEPQTWAFAMLGLSLAGLGLARKARRERRVTV